MKHKLDRLRVNRKTYFHHQNGIVVKKNKLKGFAITTSAMMIVYGVFFIGINYALPVLRNSSYFQNAKPASASAQQVAPAAPTQETSENPIKQEDELLKLAINEKIATLGVNQKWSVFVYDLSSDRTVNINVDQEYDSASLYKLFLLEALENKLAHDKWKETKIGKVKINDCVEKMLSVEDDPCSEALIEYIGKEFIDKFNQENGIKNTRLASSEGRKTTPAEVGELLIRLKKGHVLSDKSRRFIFDALYQQTYPKGIGMGCNNCRPAGKYGELTGISHDAAVVTHGRSSYVLVVMSQGGSFEQITELTKVIDERFASTTTNQTP